MYGKELINTTQDINIKPTFDGMVINKGTQKPELIMRIRTRNKNTDILDTTFSRLANNKADSVHFVAYPNPFTSSLKLRYTLKKETRVSIIVSNLQNGKIMYRSTAQDLAAGDYDTPVYFNGLPGNYIVTLQYGNKVKSAIVFKQ